MHRPSEPLIAHQKVRVIAQQKEVTLAYFSRFLFLGHHRQCLYVCSLCKLLTYGHQICVVVHLTHVHQLADSPLVSPTFQDHRSEC